jgi:putative hydrolase of the HAD superfamily
MTVKAVLFDLGNTLIYLDHYKTFQKILRIHGITRTTEEIKEAFAKAAREFDIKKQSGISAHEVYTQSNMHILKHLGITNSKRLWALAEDIDIRWFEVSKIYVYPDVKPTLTKLKKTGLKLGLITDGYKSDLEQMLPKAGLQKFFDVCVCADTIGKCKPNPHVFEYALSQLKIKPSEAVFVGDRLDTDYIGAQKAGITPILILRENKKGTKDINFITSLEEIFKLLKEMESKEKSSL